jgi:hypothetical protein
LRAAVAIVEDALKTEAIFFERRQHDVGVTKHMAMPFAGPFGDLYRRHGHGGDGA